MARSKTTPIAPPSVSVASYADRTPSFSVSVDPTDPNRRGAVKNRTEKFLLCMPYEVAQRFKLEAPKFGGKSGLACAALVHFWGGKTLQDHLHEMDRDLDEVRQKLAELSERLVKAKKDSGKKAPAVEAPA